MDDMLDKQQLEIYQRTIGLKEIGEQGQEKLLNSKVLIVGAGGLGSSVILSLSSLGIGELGIIDFDIVGPSNLPRQILYGYQDLGKLKVNVIKRLLKKRNPFIKVKTYPTRLESGNATKIIKKYDVVLDCTDNFETKFLIDDVCQKLNKVYVSAGVMDYQGQVMTVISHKTSSFKSLFDELPKSDPNEDSSIFPPAVHIVSNIAANEVVKYLLGIGDLLTDKLLVVNPLKNHYQIIEVKEK